MYKISYVGDGVTTEYLFAFPFFQDADIRVALDETVLGPENYGVVENDTFDGGTVVLNVAPAPGVKIDIFRQIALSRVVDYQPTAKIDPEDLNSDFNFLLEAMRDRNAIDLNLTEWANIHHNVVELVSYTKNLIEDKMGGGGTLGLFYNLVSVLDGALPKLIDDYGSVAEPAPNETRDDYGLL